MLAKWAQYQLQEVSLRPSPASASEQSHSPTWSPVNHLPYTVSTDKHTRRLTKLAKRQGSINLYFTIHVCRICTVISFSKVGSGWESDSSHCSSAFISEPDSKRGAVKADSSPDPWPSSTHWRRTYADPTIKSHTVCKFARHSEYLFFFLYECAEEIISYD